MGTRCSIQGKAPTPSRGWVKMSDYRSLLACFVLLGWAWPGPLAAPSPETFALPGSLMGVDLRQSGPIEIWGTFVEGGRVYLSIPVKNFGSTASPPIHPYTEGYTA